MILSGREIKRQLGKGLNIYPFREEQLNPNSYNLKLGNELLVYTEPVLDLKEDNKYRLISIPTTGCLLLPGELYLGSTIERTETNNFVPMLEGRSSLGRLGLSIHITAGFGDVGFKGRWTLEMSVVKPIIIYPGIEICQIYYHSIQGKHFSYDGGKYQDSYKVESSKMFKELQKIKN